MKRVGVLALQGDFAAHGRALRSAGAEPVYVRTARELDSVDALVLPGGESTTMLNLLHRENLFEALRQFGRKRPILGTCAGVILLAKKVTHPEQESLGLMDLTVERNGYGRQIDSSVGPVKLAKAFPMETVNGVLEGVFIRAPIIREFGELARVLATRDGQPVLVDQDHLVGCTFHPELTGDDRVHRFFLAKLAA